MPDRQMDQPFVLPERPALLHPEAVPYSERALSWTAQVQAQSRTKRDVAYGPDYWQCLDIYLPENLPVEPVPVLLFLHGGAWTGGYKEWMGFMAPVFTSLPAIFISVSYRLAPECRFPGPLDDVLDALKWTAENITDYGGDAGRIALGGHSAGGHLAALAALDLEGQQRRGLSADCVKACLPLSATFDVRAPAGQRDASQERAYRDFLANAEQDSTASPVLYVQQRPSNPLFLVAWGENDFPRLKLQGQQMVDTLMAADVITESLELSGCSHFGASLEAGDPDSAWARAARQVIRRLQGERQSE